jgi:hypothetical protein
MVLKIRDLLRDFIEAIQPYCGTGTDRFFNEVPLREFSKDNQVLIG